MNILTIYTESAEKAVAKVVELASTNKSTIKVLAYDPARLYNDDKYDDVSMAAVTFSTDDDWETINKFINDNSFILCEEDPLDW